MLFSFSSFHLHLSVLLFAAVVWAFFVLNSWRICFFSSSWLSEWRAVATPILALAFPLPQQQNLVVVFFFYYKNEILSSTVLRIECPFFFFSIALLLHSLTVMLSLTLPTLSLYGWYCVLWEYNTADCQHSAQWQRHLLLPRCWYSTRATQSECVCNGGGFIDCWAGAEVLHCICCVDVVYINRRCLSKVSHSSSSSLQQRSAAVKQHLPCITTALQKNKQKEKLFGLTKKLFNKICSKGFDKYQTKNTKLQYELFLTLATQTRDLHFS